MAEQVLRQRRVPGNKGMRYPADPPTIEEIVAVMRQAGDGRSAARIRALIVVLWRRLARQRGADAQRGRPRSQWRIDPRAVWQGRSAARGRDGSVGLGADPAVVGASLSPAGRATVLRDQWAGCEPPVVQLIRAS
jgi:hypothetical protein